MPPLKNVLRVIIIVAVILLIPLVLTIRDGGVEGVGWNWTLSDFVIMGTIMFLFGLAIDFAARRIRTPLTRVIAIAAIIFVFLALWAQLAVQAVSQFVDFLFS